jgi:phage terminase large subunit GpA-like protein
MLSGEAVYGEGWREGWTLPPLLTVSEWADAWRVLSQKAASEHGRWTTDRTPYLREVMDCLSASSPIEQTVVMKGVQLGFSEAGNNWIGYVIDQDPAPMMLVQPTTNTAKRYSRQRIAPMIDDTPALRERVAKNRSRDDANSTLMKDFPGGVLVIAGANSASDLRSMPVRYLMLDEIDGYPQDVDGEGDPVTLAENRTLTFARRKIYKPSTPTVRGMSKVESAYQASDRRRFWVPCPHCHEHQVLRWEQLRWRKDDAGVAMPETTVYVCEHCGAEIDERYKPEMLAGGQWRADAPGAGGGRVAGFHLSSLYSPLGWLSWEEMVREFLSAKEKQAAGDLSLLKVFVNTKLAETWEDQGERVAAHDLVKRAEAYPLREVPFGGFVVTAGVDVQADRLEFVLDAWGRGEESWTVDRGVLYGDPALTAEQEGSPWKALDELLATPIAHKAGGQVLIRAMAIDSGGHFTQEVYNYCRPRSHRHVFAVKGASTGRRPVIATPNRVDVSYRGQKIKSGVKLWLVGTDTAKSTLYGRMRLAGAGPGYMHFSRDLPPEWFEQLTAEVLVTRYVNGRVVMQWTKSPGKRNEALDCKVYSYAAAHYLGVPRWREPDWVRIERMVAPSTPDLFNASPEVVSRGADSIGTTAPTPAVRAPAESRPDAEWLPRSDNWLS